MLKPSRKLRNNSKRNGGCINRRFLEFTLLFASLPRRAVEMGPLPPRIPTRLRCGAVFLCLQRTIDQAHEVGRSLFVGADFLLHVIENFGGHRIVFAFARGD